jgi:hypothetical protein
MLNELHRTFAYADKKASPIHFNKIKRALGFEGEPFHYPQPVSIFSTTKPVAAESHDRPGAKGDNDKDGKGFQDEDPVTLPRPGKCLTD